MEEKFLAYFSSISPLNEEESRAIVAGMITHTYPKGHFLLKEGEIALDTFFILKGCVREYVEIEGEEKTTNFFTEDQWVIGLNSFAEQKPSTHNWICMEETTLVVGNEEQAQELFKDFPRFETISRAIMEKALFEQKEALTAYLTDSPEQRYLKLLETRPNLFQRVPQYQLASYIGVKPESLSRIRKRLSKK